MNTELNGTVISSGVGALAVRQKPSKPHHASHPGSVIRSRERIGLAGGLLVICFRAILMQGVASPPIPVALPWEPAVQPTKLVRAQAFAPVLSPSLSSSSWTSLGPAPIVNGQRPGNGPVSGRLTGIAAHPTDANTIYVTAAGGGVWKTIDGGTTWSPLTDAQSTVSMGAIAISPSNPNVIYAGTGEANNSLDSNFGRGVLVSTDGGSSWTLQNNGGTFDRKAVSEIAVDPSDANIAYVALADFAVNSILGDTGIWKTTDGGATWVNLTATITSFHPWSSVRIDPGNHLTVYAAVGNLGGTTENGVYKTTDGGSTWRLLTGAPNGNAAGRIVVAVAPSNPQVVYVSAQGTSPFGSLYKFMRSDNGGSTFTDLTAATPNYMGGQGWYDTTLVADPVNSAIVYAGGQNGLLRSANSGANWTDISSSGALTAPHVDHHGAAFDANGRYLDGDDGGIYRLDDPGTVTWTQLNGNLNTIQFQGLGLHPSNPNTVLGGSQDNGVSMYNGNPGWTLVEGGDGGKVKFSPTNPSRAYHQIPFESFGVNFFRRSDAGGAAGTWQTATLGITDDDQQNFYAPFVVDPGNGDRVLYGALHLWETLNGGGSWVALGPPFPGNVSAIGLAAANPNVIYAAVGANTYVTTDRGATWSFRSLPVSFGVSDIQVDPNNSQNAYACVNNFSPGAYVFRTTDAGLNWANISGDLPNVPVWSIQLDPSSPGTIYVGNDIGVYKTVNSGASWTRFGSGLPNAQVFEIQLNSNLGILGAATHGRGIWEISTSGGPVTTTATTVSAAAGQYSDVVTLNAAVSPAGVAGAVEFLVNGAAIPGTPTYDSTSGSAQQSYTIPLAKGPYTIQGNFTSADARYEDSSGSGTLTVSCEDAVVTPSSSNPLTVKVATAGGASGSFTLNASIVEVSDGSLGDISKATPVFCTLTPIGSGPGSSIMGVTSGGGVGGRLSATFTFSGMPINVYAVVFNVGGNYYTGSAETVLAVYDPSSGFVTGGGRIVNPKTGFPANFGFHGRILKSGNAQGGLLYVEHQPAGDVILKSNSMGPLAIINNRAILSGKATLNGIGNYGFILNVADNGEPATSDLFGLQVLFNNAALPALTFAPVNLTGGNIQVPHK